MAKHIVKKIVVGFVVLCVVFVFDYWLFAPKNISEPESKETNQQESTLPEQEKNSENENIPFQTETKKKGKPDNNLAQQDTEDELILKPQKKSFKLNVPFISQSPYKKWDHLHNEACEEASLVMASHWINSTPLNKKIADQKIKNSVSWQKENWGGHYDLNAKDTIELAKGFFNIKKIYFTDIKSIDEIKYFLEQGKLVLAPMAGRNLDNPYFQTPGPAYHMVVVVGFEKEHVITNDPGTFRGKSFKYPDKNFINSLHDWPFKKIEKNDLTKDQKAQEILKGKKRIIIIEK